jgi:response regulator of citrate/malate metabolism
MSLSDDIWQEIADYFCTETKQPGDITIEDAAERYGVSRYTARKRLQAAVDAGKLTKLMAIHNGRRTLIYRRVV